MNIKIPKPLFEVVGSAELKKFGLEVDRFRYEPYVMLDVRKFNEAKTDKLIALLTPAGAEKVRGAFTALEDLKVWKAALADPDTIKVRNAAQLEGVLIGFLAKLPNHRIFQRDAQRSAWYGYYVSQVWYKKPERTRDGRIIPGYVGMMLCWEEFGIRQSEDVHFDEADCRGFTVSEALSRKGYVAETDVLNKEYDTRTARYWETVDQIGMQHLATGIATDNLDGNSRRDGNGNHFWYKTTTYALDSSKVVIDLFNEEPGAKHEGSISSRFKHDFWMKHMEEDDAEDTDELEELAAIPFPVHHTLAVFHLKKHKRLRVDIGQVEPYKWVDIGNRLVLPSDVKALIGILLEHKGDFQDVVEDKGAGAIVAAGGPSGTGKTLTAEVYSEVSQRPLYNVQCSQLGITPAELEDELLKVLDRAERWKAILLLDEADVYVRERGADLVQNAIVGVFLRVFEYYAGVMFLTTNRLDIIDDAILSRCIARIEYENPSPEDQIKIWKILRETSGAAISDEVIEAVAHSGKYSGRDVRSLLRLSTLVAKAGETEVTEKTIEFVKRFKPTK